MNLDKARLNILSNIKSHQN